MTLFEDTKTVGFIGLGIMGRAMAGHILAAGHDLHVFNRTRARADDLVAAGATWHDTPGELAAACEVVITIVGYPADVEAIYLGQGGIVERAREGAVLVDMTTSSPSLAVRIAEAARARGVTALDAPVSGGDVGARAGKLSIMVGGDGSAFEAVLPILELMGGKIVRQGEAGAGQHAKMANQIAIASTTMAMCECLAYARKSGLDPRLVLESISTGAASSFLLNNLGPRVLDGDFAPGFFVHHFIKDMAIALSEAGRMGLDLPGLALARKLYDRLAAQGHGEDGTQGLFRLYEAQL